MKIEVLFHLLYLQLAILGTLVLKQKKILGTNQDPDLILTSENDTRGGLSECICSINKKSDRKKIMN